VDNLETILEKKQKIDKMYWFLLHNKKRRSYGCRPGGKNQQPPTGYGLVMLSCEFAEMSIEVKHA